MPAVGSPDQRLQRATDKLNDREIADSDREAIEAAVLADSELAKMSKESYAAKLGILAETADGPLTAMQAGEIADHVDSLADTRGWSDSTCQIYESAAMQLLEYLGVDSDAVEITTKSDQPAVDERSVLTPDEFHDIREATNNQRDKALVDFLGLCGQRVRVAQALRWEDVDLDAGVWYMPDASGLKGADKQGNKRPLLGARKSLAEWRELHPTGEPEDHIFTATAGESAGSQISQTTLRNALSAAADAAGVEDKPTNPHAFRHYFVTQAVRRHDMAESTIKHILGHAADSNLMGRTYRHLSDEDHVTEAMEAVGLEPDQEDHQAAPPVCAACQRPLRPSVDVCPTPGCDERFTEPRTKREELHQLADEVDEKLDRLEKLQESLDV